MTNSPLKGWFASLRSDTFSCHLHLCLLINPQEEPKLSEAPARKAEQPPKRLCCSDISTQTFPLGFSSTSRQWGALEPAHADSLWLPHWEHVSARDPLKVLGPKHKQAPSVVRALPSKPGQWLCPSARACVGSKAEIQPWDPWSWALSLLGISLGASHLFCQLKSLLTLLSSWHCPSWEAKKFLAQLYSTVLSSTLKGWRWKMTFD